MRSRLHLLRAIRETADERIGEKADVIGSMLALKLVGGVPRRHLGITYFVREKIPLKHLSKRKRIPKQLTIGKTTFKTDVLEWPNMAQQSLKDASIIFDGKLQGTLTCFGHSDAGVFGVSCAHCLEGVDGNPATPTPVSMYSDDSGQFVDAGSSIYALFSPGPGRQDDFGYIDCGLFDIQERTLLGRANAASPLGVIEDEGSLIGKRLIATSALNAPNWPDHNRSAIVVGLHANALNERCDLVLQADAPGTFHGDSGMLWKTEDGQAAGIHARGEVMPAMVGSRLVTAMAAHRVASRLGVTLALG